MHLELPGNLQYGSRVKRVSVENSLKETKPDFNCSFWFYTIYI